ncbi:hypothetical protein ACFSTC_61860 [Nonomuraea ferruginea]
MAARRGLRVKGGDLFLAEASPALRLLISLMEKGRRSPLPVFDTLPQALAACGVCAEPAPPGTSSPAAAARAPGAACHGPAARHDAALGTRPITLRPEPLRERAGPLRGHGVARTDGRAGDRFARISPRLRDRGRRCGQ